MPTTDPAPAIDSNHLNGWNVSKAVVHENRLIDGYRPGPEVRESFLSTRREKSRRVLVG